MTLTAFRTLGRSGLVISPMALGAMTFGTQGWGTDETGSRAIFDAYVEAGGNFIDTADVYSGGQSERLVGRFVKDAGLSDRIVVATKSGFGTSNHPHSGGNGAKHVRAAVEGSLKRLGMDAIDLYWVHVWDMVTPAEELLETLSGLIHSGKIRYYGLSNVPAWYAAQLATLAKVHGMPGPVAVQFEYSLVERGVEAELIPVAEVFGMGLVPWSPLGGGFLTGKYSRDDSANRSGKSVPSLPDGKARESSGGTGRLSGSNPFGDSKFTDRNWSVLEAVKAVAREVDVTPAQVALAWLSARRPVDAILIGASRPSQVADNAEALAVSLSADQTRRLDAASEPQPSYPSTLFTPFVNRLVFGGAEVKASGR
ncbi:aldo/keto reductase [Brevundimonas sp. LM2]|uniref:aldo/keto reductase n=1 Tax=Brevundimonas sp. LM2 TaxID=1938605 RepID=UPI000983A9B0|nr:aldo/keto reductase [Brevundimonas sp. LM2]AQR63069.1 aldo/keto reductase [Brevundimonas sp. LM2]